MRDHDGTTRYSLELDMLERDAALDSRRAGELLQREFQRAQNASHFIRIAVDDFGVTLAARERVGTAHPALRAA